MALIPCEECGNEVSTTAQACPKCGAKVVGPLWKLKGIFIYLIIVVIAISFIAVQISIAISPDASSADATTSETAEPEVSETPEPEVSETPEAAAPETPEATAPETPEPSDAPVYVSAIQLYDDYQANEVSADIKYKGKMLIVKGTVTSINKDVTDEIWVGMKTSNDFMPVHLTELSQDQAARLNKGDIISATCLGAGLMIGSPVLKCGRPKQ